MQNARIDLRCGPGDLRRMDALVAAGFAATRAAVVREAVVLAAHTFEMKNGPGTTPGRSDDVADWNRRDEGYPA